MSISNKYLEYLSLFRTTARLVDFSKKPQAGIYLRHDVDHDLDIALEMAYHEYQRNCSATYFILPTAPYWEDPRLIEKCLQIQDFGHEIGLHLNYLTSWIKGKTDSIRSLIEKDLDRLRSAGVHITGISAHGDRLCYSENFINYWLFSELRPKDPIKSEDGLSAEGIFDPTGERSVNYPVNHQVSRYDGLSFNLWSLSMKDLGLSYDANHLNFDAYFSDSGGKWKRTPDPRKADLNNKSAQILFHPIYYKGTQRKLFVLSTARSGSKWFSEVLEKATPFKGHHEFTLNHEYINGQLVSNKRTGPQFTKLLKQPDLAQELIMDTLKYMESLKFDYAECNVYLPHFLTPLQRLIPDAEFIHLMRDPNKILESLLNRDWYDTPEDDRHPAFKLKEWSTASQAEKAATYIAQVTTAVAHFTPKRALLEELTESLDSLTRIMKQLGIPFYPRLAGNLCKTRINAGKKQRIQALADLQTDEQEKVSQILEPIHHFQRSGDKSNLPTLFREADQIANQRKSGEKKVIYRFPYLFSQKLISARKESTVRRKIGQIQWHPAKSENDHLVFGGGTWSKPGRLHKGWPIKHSYYYKIESRFDLKDGIVNVYALTYDTFHQIVEKKLLGCLSDNDNKFAASFRVNDKRAKYFKIGFYSPKEKGPQSFTLKAFTNTRIPL